MFIKKLGGSVVAITAMLAFNAAMAADSCLDLATEIALQSNLVACPPDGTYTATTIWQKRGKGENGCEVHLGLAQQLYIPFDPNQPPLEKKNPKAKGEAQAVAKGAAAALRDRKIEDAVLHLTNFITTIDADPTTDEIIGAAKLNSENLDAEGQARILRDWALGVRTKVESGTY